MKVIMVDEVGGIVFSGENTMLKSHVQAYTRSDGTMVKEHDDSRQKKMEQQPAGKPSGGDAQYGGHPNVVGKATHKEDATSASAINFHGKDYESTGKSGKSMHDQTPVREFEHGESGHRVWMDGQSNVHADSSDEVKGLRAKTEGASGNGAYSKSSKKAEELSKLADSTNKDDPSYFSRHDDAWNAHVNAANDADLEGDMDAYKKHDAESDKHWQAKQSKSPDQSFSKDDESPAIQEESTDGDSSGSSRMHPTGEKKKGEPAGFSTNEGGTGKMEGGIHPIEASPADVEKKLGMKAGSLSSSDGGYSVTHTVTDNHGNSHHVYANDGQVRVRAVGKGDPASTEALKKHLNGTSDGADSADKPKSKLPTGRGIPKQADPEATRKAGDALRALSSGGEMKHGDAYSSDNLPKKGDKVKVTDGRVGEVLASHGSRVSVWHEGKDGGGDVSENHPGKVFAHKE